MMQYSIQPKDRLFVKAQGFLSFPKNIGKMLVKILAKTQVKTEIVNIARNSLIMLNNLPQMSLKLLQEEQFKKQQKQLVI